MQKIHNLYKNKHELILYLIFGFLTTIIGFGIYYLLTLVLLNPNNIFQLQIANIVSWIISVLFAYLTNRVFVFKSKNKSKLQELSSFFTTRIITLMMDMIIMAIGVTIFKQNDRIIKIISQIVVIISNYLFSKLIVFNKNKVIK